MSPLPSKILPFLGRWFLLAALLYALFLGLLLFINPAALDAIPLYPLLLTTLIALILAAAAEGALAWQKRSWPRRLNTAPSLTFLCVGFLLVIVAQFGFSSAQRAAMQQPQNTRLLIIGLDAATWPLLDPWIEAGKLPHIASLCQRGAKTTLHSMEPMRSPRLWTSIATGRSPENHRVEGFFDTRAQLKAPRIFDLAQANGQRVGLMHWLVTWPVNDAFDFVVPGWMAREPDALPPALIPLQEIMLDRARGGGKPNGFKALWRCLQAGAGWRAVSNLARFYAYTPANEEARLAQKMIGEVRLQSGLFLALRHRYDPHIAAITFYGSDKLAHRFWHHMRPGEFPDHELPTSSPHHDVILRYYQAADAAIGRMIEGLPADCHVVLLSDHGMKADPALPGRFFLRTHELLKALNLEKHFRATLVQGRILLEPNAASDAPPRLERFEAIHWADDQQPLFTVTQEDEGIFLRPRLSMTAHPESPLGTDRVIVVDGQRFPAHALFEARYFSGTHSKQGILVISGPGVRAGATFEDAHLLDIAPTLLRILGLPLSQELEGQAIEAAFTETWRTEHPIRTVEQYPPLEQLAPAQETPAAVDEDYLDRLRSRGYL